MLTSTLLALALGLTPAKISIELRDFADGELVSKERSFRVVVTSDHPVRNVEFYVGDNLRDSDSSTPYEFKIDPLNEPDGDLKLTFAAYTTEGESTKKIVTVKIDTGASKGADFHVEAGNASLASQKWADAIYSARIALKAKPAYAPARMLLARAFMGQGAFDRAQTFAEEVLASDANNPDAKELLAGINLRKAFNTFSSGNREETIKTISGALKTAVELRRQNLDAQLDALPAPDDSNILKWTDVALRVGRNNAAAKALDRHFAKAPGNAAIGNRLAFAQLREFNLTGADYTLMMMEKEGALDSYGYALAAILASLKGDEAKVDKMLAEAEANDPMDIGLRTAKAYIAVRRNRPGTLNKVVADLAGDQGQRPESNYYLNVLQSALNNFVDADRAFESAILAEPAFVDMYVEKGNQSLAFLQSNRLTDSDQKKYQTALASAYFQAALESKPDSAQALTAYALQQLAENKTAEALSYSDAVMRANNNYPAGFFAAAAIFSQIEKSYAAKAAQIRKDAKGPLDDSQRKEVTELERVSSDLKAKSERAKKRAVELDPKGLGGIGVPTSNEAYVYFYRYGRMPLITLPR